MCHVLECSSGQLGLTLTPTLTLTLPTRLNPFDGVQGKIVFVAPTKPLLTQQVEACYRQMGVPRVSPAHCSAHSGAHEIAVLTGAGAARKYATTAEQACPRRPYPPL